MSKKRTWLWVLAAIGAICVIGLVVVAIAGIVFVRQHVETRTATSADADRAFESAKERFKGQVPLIELEAGDAKVTRRLAELPTSSVTPANLWLLVWEPDDQQLVRMSLPFWILRFGRQNFQTRGRNFDLERLNLDVKELERIGPTLLMDQRMPSGERVLIWTQ
jgi:hypothetical protein